MDNYKHLCPVCKAKGNTSFLQLRQINLNTAVYLCKDIRCEYPLGHSWIYEDRTLSDSGDDDSDSDLSDVVNNDIEKMDSLLKKFDFSARNVENHISNKLFTEHSKFGSSDTTNKHEHESLKFKDISHNINQNSVRTLREEVEDINCSSVVDNVKHISNKLNTESSISASSLTTNKHEYKSLKHKDNISDNINQYSVRTSCEEVENMHCTSIVDNVQSEIHKSTSCDDITFIESAHEVENVIIDDPNELFSSLDLPCDTVTTNENYKILATGAENTEVVDVEVSEIIKSSDAQYEIVKNQGDPNMFRIDIKMPNLIHDNKVHESEKENEINTPVIEKNLQKKFVILNAKTGTYSKLNEVPEKNANEVNIIKLPDNILKKKPNTLQHINSNEILDIIQPNQIKNMEVVSKNNFLPPEKKTNNSVTENSETSNKYVSSNNIDTRIQYDNEDLVLPFANDANVEFKSLYKSKLKLHAKKNNKPKFHLPESVVEDALKTLQGHVSSDFKKKNSVQVISGKNKTKMPKNKTAASFEGFKFSSKVIKQASPKNKHVDSLDQLELRNFLQANKSKRRNKEKRKYESHDDENLLNMNNSDTSSSSMTSDTSNPNDKTNLGMGDLTLNEIFDNMDDLSAVNVPNSSANITEVDDWLNSLCE